MNGHPNAHPGAGPYTNSAEVAAALLATGERAERKAEQVVRQFGLLLETRVKGGASGRPGPRAVTGDYRRSINTRFGRTGGRFAATVGTNAPQARRLEYGFVGADRLGRVYNQPPYPHFGPAVLAVEPSFRDAMARVV